MLAVSVVFFLFTNLSKTDWLLNGLVVDLVKTIKVLSFNHPAAFKMLERLTSLEIAAEVLADCVLCAEKIITLIPAPSSTVLIHLLQVSLEIWLLG